MSFELLADATQVAFNWPTIGWLVFGVVLGSVIGAIPGLGPVVGISVLLPFTLPLGPINGLIFLLGIYLGASYGASISAILINTPGTAVAAATAVDGYPMAQKGLAANALAISALGSAVGGLISVALLIILIPYLSQIVLAFGSIEYLLVAVLGVSLIGIIDADSLIKGYTAGAVGLLISSVGVAPMVQEFRYTYRIVDLYDGLSFVAILIGVFAMAEMMKLATKTGGISESGEIRGSALSGIKTTISEPFLILKSSLIGMSIGAIPGAGASISNFVSYAEAKRSSDNPEKYGKGEPQGVLASEGANSATAAGALIPTLSFGIPGSGTTAVLLGALLLHGLQPGPELFTEQLDTTYTLLSSLFIGNFVIIIFGLVIISRASIITQIDTHKIIPMIMVVALLGTLTLRNNWIDVFTVVLIGGIGYLMIKHNYSIIALILGVILGPILEENLVRARILLSDNATLLLDRPIAMVLIVILIVVNFYPVWPYITKSISRRKSRMFS